MFISQLVIEHVRIIDHSKIRPGPHINFVIGKNGSGKTSILEAIAILATTRSFRTDRISQVISSNSNHLLVLSNIIDKDDKSNQIGVERKRNNDYKVRINFSLENNRSLAEKISIQVINPKISDLIFAGGKNRRDFLDWGVFHVEHLQRNILQNFKKSLKQRNHYLRERKIEKKQIELWNNNLAQNAEKLTNVRVKQLQKIAEIFNKDYAKLLSFGKFDFVYDKGWGKDQSFLKALTNNIQRDIKYGTTSTGPHLAEIKILVNGNLDKDKLSRGEAKLLSFLVRLAQIKLFIASRNKKPILLLDDISAELDESNREIIMACITDLKTQSFITANTKEQIRLKTTAECKVFHVKHGMIEES